MGKFILRRLVQGIPTVFAITLITFLLMLAAPGDPVTLITFNPGRATDKELVESMKRKLGLDQPPVVQYIYWLVGNDWTLTDSDGDGFGDTPGERRGFLRGDLGNSINYKKPVTQLILERVPATLQLAFTALIVGYGLGILLGVLAAIYHRTWIDNLVRILSVIGNAVPPFWLGLMLIIVFSVKLKILPMGGMRDVSSRGGFDVFEMFKHMLLPTLVFSLNQIAFVSRFVRTQLLEVLTQDYIRTARAKGLSNRAIWLKHATRNALLPVATFLGPAVGTLLSGAVIIEQVFDWPGMGRLTFNAVFQRDYPLVMGSVVVASILFILGVILSDILYVILDPRIRLK
jgi:peptide/nickel transport system permease protein